VALGICGLVGVAFLNGGYTRALCECGASWIWMTWAATFLFVGMQDGVGGDRLTFDGGRSEGGKGIVVRSLAPLPKS
jgi:hypothetical protein